MERNGVEWNGIEWRGTGWNGAVPDAVGTNPSHAPAAVITIEPKTPAKVPSTLTAPSVPLGTIFNVVMRYVVLPYALPISDATGCGWEKPRGGGWAGEGEAQGEGCVGEGERWGRGVGFAHLCPTVSSLATPRSQP